MQQENHKLFTYTFDDASIGHGVALIVAHRWGRAILVCVTESGSEYQMKLKFTPSTDSPIEMAKFHRTNNGSLLELAIKIFNKERWGEKLKDQPKNDASPLEVELFQNE